MKKFIIDTQKPFAGYALYAIDGDKAAYSGISVDVLLKENPSYKLVSKCEINRLITDYYNSLNTSPFEEITEDRYRDLEGAVPPIHWSSTHFFMGECYQYDLYLFCFIKNGRFFSGLRAINTDPEALKKEIENFNPKN